MMQRYLEVKAQQPAALLLFRMGAFYELFYEDAVQAAKLLNLTLTSSDKNSPPNLDEDEAAEDEEFVPAAKVEKPAVADTPRALSRTGAAETVATAPDDKLGGYRLAHRQQSV